ncbi:MAG: manA [Flaviaesturariibacter sp.]|nr:manA [Flaviaesturariibacter sp.]
MGSFYLLEGKVQHYSWGGTHFLPALLKQANPDGQPFAEYWLGAHPMFPSRLQSNAGKISLQRFIEQNKADVLGGETSKQFQSLPFLFKILDVKNMLSIQVHPNLQQAAVGFAEENEAGISLQSPHRNYKDENHKPELMVALSDFWLLHGFKPQDLLAETLEKVTELQPLLPHFQKGGYQGLYEYVMLPSNDTADQILAALKERIIPLYGSNALDKSNPDFWAARALQTFGEDGKLDKGIFSIYFFNLLHLKRGEGIFQDAGLPHAYLEGQNVEIMANSDNVLRAGLTDKHIDVAELLKLVRFEPTFPKVLKAVEAFKATYDSPAAEFELSRYRLRSGQKEELHFKEVALLFCLSGLIRVQNSFRSLLLEAGQAVLVEASTQFVLAADVDADVFVATVPPPKN